MGYPYIVCGIVGFTGPAYPETLARMTRSLRHRGPDGEGLASIPDGRPIVHFGHRRLAVLDPEGGYQPMSTADGRWWITFNGQIYNHLDLRARLEAAGERFRTRSDTEVLLLAVARWEDAALTELDGMFAFAVFDATEHRLLLAVDRFGQKPLVYTILSDGRLVFASELTAMRGFPSATQELDTLAVCRMLAFNHPPAPQTIWRNVQRFEPGSALSIQLGTDGTVRGSRAWRFWQPFAGKQRERQHVDNEAFISALRASVRHELVADVPVGVLLSGGVDSTVIAALAAADRPITTLSMGFGEAEFDESAEARATAHALGTHHHELHLGGDDAVATLNAVMGHLDEPLADAGCLPTWHLFRTARSVVTVAVGGDGGDELLEGYPTFYAFDLLRGLGPLSRAANALRPLAGWIPVSDGYYPWGYQARRFLAGAGARPWYRLQMFMGGCPPWTLREVLRPELLSAADLRGSAHEFADRLFEPAWPPALRAANLSTPDADRVVQYHLRSYMAGEVLRKVDRMSMAHGLEVRAPMLGAPFADLCLSVPSRRRRQGRRGKRPLRDWLHRMPALAQASGRPKRGFAIPVSRWLRNEFRGIADEVFLSDGSPLAQWCQMDRVKTMWLGHRDGHRDDRKELWALLTLGLWMQHHLRAGAPEAR
jgi:asparagine synthase (glutamine-hydrolysing)